MDEAKKLLDSLMGTHRNVDRKEAEARKGSNFKGANVCKYYLLGFCPQYEELFTSTKRDIGRCEKVHSDALKVEFDSSPDKDKYEAEYLRDIQRYLEGLIRGAEDWASRERRHIEAANKEIRDAGPNDLAKKEINGLNEQASALMLEAEEAAEKGDIQKSKEKVELANSLKEKATTYEEKAKTLQREDVCDICGSRLESGDPQHAKFKHQEGKIHTGYERLRNFLAEAKKRSRDLDLKKPRDKSRGRSRSRRDRNRDKEASNGVSDRDRGGNRGSDRDRDRDRNRDRDRERNRDRDRRR